MNNKLVRLSWFASTLIALQLSAGLALSAFYTVSLLVPPGAFDIDLVSALLIFLVSSTAPPALLAFFTYFADRGNRVALGLIAVATFIHVALIPLQIVLFRDSQGLAFGLVVTIDCLVACAAGLVLVLPTPPR